MKRIVVLSIITLLVAVACSKAGDSLPPEPTPLPSPLTAEEIMLRSSAKLDALSSFHFELDQEGGGIPIAMGLEMTRASGDIVRPDKLKIKALAGFIEVEIITVGDITYMTHPLTGEFEPLPNEFTAVTLFDPDNGITAIIAGITEGSTIGEEEVDGVPCYHIRGILDSGELKAISCGFATAGIPIDTEVWIGKEDFLLRQVKLTGQMTEEEERGIIRTLLISDFDRSITIQLP